MKTLVVSASPKRYWSNSAYFAWVVSHFCGDCEQIYLRGKREYDRLISSFLETDRLVIALPLYVDAVPSQILELLQILEEIARENGRRISVYAITNCGFYEGVQCRLALEMLSCWCERAQLDWCGGIGVGAGEMLGAIRILPPIAVLIPILQWFVSLIVQLIQGDFSFVRTFAWVNLIPSAILLLSFCAFSARPAYRLIQFAGKIKQGQPIENRYTTVSCCPAIAFMCFASAFWVLRALGNLVPVWKLFARQEEFIKEEEQEKDPAV